MIEVATALGLDPTREDRDTLIDVLRKRDKYLDLSIAGSETRGDWSEGCYRVEDALGRFKVETPTDEQISEDWSAICADFDDGRAFRDCKWSYDTVMELASPEIVSLYSKLTSED